MEEVDIGQTFTVPIRTHIPDIRSEADQILDDVNQIRNGLRKIVNATEAQRLIYGYPSPLDVPLVHMACFQQREARKIESFLTPWERKRVVFTWSHDV